LIPGETIATKDTVYTATYTQDVIRYTIRFIDWDETLLRKKKYDAGAEVTIPNPSREGYTLIGWQNTSVAEDYVPVGTSIYANGNYTYQAIYQEIGHNIELLADVSWKIDNDGGGTIHHGDGNVYETTSWMYNTDGAQMPINLRYEPMYKINGSEVNYYTVIGSCDGYTFTHEDLEWDASIGTIDGHPSLYNHMYDLDIIFRTFDNTHQDAGDSVITKVVYIDGEKADDGSIHKGHGMSVKSEGTQWDQDFAWLDKIPIVYTAKFNGIPVFNTTMNIIPYSGDAIAGYPYNRDERNVPAGTMIGKSIPPSPTGETWGGTWISSIHRPSDRT